MESPINQLYALEKEYLENKSKLDQFQNTEMLCIQNKLIYDYSLKALEAESEGREIYQPLGRAFLKRNKNELADDLKSLLESNNKQLEESKNMKKVFEEKTKGLETQLIEMTKTIKL